MIIDAHIHLGLNSFCKPKNQLFQYNLENSINEQILFMKQNGIDKCAILPIPNYDEKESNDYINDAIFRYPEYFFPFFRLDKSLSDNILKNNFAGAKYHAVYEKYSKPKFCEYLKILEYYNAPLFIHEKFAEKIKQIKEIINIAPNLKIIIAHLGRNHIYTDEGVDSVISEFSQNKNIFFETSTGCVEGTIDRICKLVSSERIIFGSDFPFGRDFQKDEYSYQKEIDLIMNSNIPFSDKENILSKNFLNLVNLCCRDKTYIAPVGERIEEVWEKLHSLDETDKKFLAINQKWQVIRNNLKSNTHVFVLIYENSIAGFFRESGRSDNFSLLEEIVIFPEFRGKGFAKKIMEYYLRFFSKSLAKTNGQNSKIISLLEKFGYERESGSRIISWKRDIAENASTL